MPIDGQTWSDELIEYTRHELGFWIENKKAIEPIRLKHIGSAFGLIENDGITPAGIAVTDRETGEQITFADVDALISAGWAID